MPNDRELSEIFERLRTVETVVNGHVSGCGEQNRARDRWESKMEGEVGHLRVDVASLNASRAQMMGYVAGASAVGSIIGAVLSAIVPKLLGQ